MLRKLRDTLGLGRISLASVALLIGLWVVLIIASGAGWNPSGVGWDFSNTGAFGDSFGPLSAIMAAIAALGAIAAYRAQVNEATRAKARQEEQDLIAMSDRERFIRREIETEKRLEKATFETTFFKLLDSFRSIVSTVDIKTGSGTIVSAHDAYHSIMKTMEFYSSTHDTIEASWNSLCEKYLNDLNHYFRFLYHVILYVDCSTVGDKYFYVRLVRAMLSEAEIVLLALNCHYGEGREKFKSLVEKYSLLHNISNEARLRWNLDALYTVDAFERQALSA